MVWRDSCKIRVGIEMASAAENDRQTERTRIRISTEQSKSFEVFSRVAQNFRQPRYATCSCIS